MKKIIALFLSFILMIGCCMISASAQSNKISVELQTQMDDRHPDSAISLYITYAFYPKTVADMPSWPDIKAARAEYKEYTKAKQNDIQSVVFNDIDYIVIFDDMPDSIFVTVSVADVEKIASYPIVKEIRYYEDVASEEPDLIEPAIEPDTESYLFFDLFDAKYRGRYNMDQEQYVSYDEVYYHYNANHEIDWALLYVEALISLPSELHQIVGNRLVNQGELYCPFETGYGIYDVQKDEFISVSNFTIKNYRGLGRVFDQNCHGRLIGDADRDGELTITDATVLQRCDVQMQDYPDDDHVDDPNFSDQISYYSDFNRDGDRDIMDATCIQRYLLDLPYTIGRYN